MKGIHFHRVQIILSAFKSPVRDATLVALKVCENQNPVGMTQRNVAEMIERIHKIVHNHRLFAVLVISPELIISPLCHP